MMKIYDLPVIEPNPEALSYQQERIQQLKQDPRILRFLSRNDLDIEVLETDFPFFDRWLLFLDNDASVSNLQIEGYQYQLVYDGDFFFQYVKTEEQIAKEDKVKFMDRIIINHIPNSMKFNSLANIKIEESMDEQYQITLLKLNRFLANPQSNDGFYLYGGVGSGKTYLMAALINDLAKSGYRVGFVNMVRFLQELRNSFTTDDRFATLMYQAKTVDYLVLDDIGAEVVSDWSLRILIEILDERMNNNLSTHFTTNFATQPLFNYYTRSQSSFDEINAKRIMDRIGYLSTPYMINRESQRVNRKQ